MPVYDYLCEECGPFTALNSIANYKEPCDCPSCEAESPRVMLNVPRLAMMSNASRTAHATNERSADSPKRSKNHGPNCGCCGGGSSKMPSKTLHHSNGAKSFPTKRPWMISH
ncbi:FmdB family zinc ribbon protein [Dinoroseobacter sp. S76]|uniref:FmdB family zinc ribbon protein n=1 Tax=Dinoroseobacter sp. S76 TaxID=3415124 RepID=UPI003C7EBE12